MSKDIKKWYASQIPVGSWDAIQVGTPGQIPPAGITQIFYTARLVYGKWVQVENPAPGIGIQIKWMPNEIHPPSPNLGGALRAKSQEDEWSWARTFILPGLE